MIITIDDITIIVNGIEVIDPGPYDKEQLQRLLIECDEQWDKTCKRLNTPWPPPWPPSK